MLFEGLGFAFPGLHPWRVWLLLLFFWVFGFRGLRLGFLGFGVLPTHNARNVDANLKAPQPLLSRFLEGCWSDLGS